MREHLYALGVSCIEFIQYWFTDWAPYFEQINNFYNPNNVLDILFPVVSFVDSVFASQLLLVTSFGGWLNCVMKWWLLEDRPYWWVRETDYYNGTIQPKLMQTIQTCETGPGSPSGHTSMAASVLVLAVMWMSHIFNDRKWDTSLWKWAIYPIFATQLLSVMLARTYIATHFPHQCLLGALVGAFIAPALCIYVSDPYIWQYGPYVQYTTGRAIKWHVFCSLVAIAISVVTYYSLVLCHVDPHYTVKLAFKWCEQPERIHVSTTPLFALAQCGAALLGWALAVTPSVARFRHDTYKRSFIISAFTTIVITYSFHYIEGGIPRDSVFKFYVLHFLLNATKPLFYLRLVPELSMWPFSGEK
ncbi:glucose-6-phosphatase 2 [Zerene cesonia]|uniref:glucose-6-phosphatase 2 n=1 Tax=Zerene cesonia TaxID=33412 RepID=UPI0018E4FBA7|nr:glucose-6-phosphatase 2 [Zerene cesonia]